LSPRTLCCPTWPDLTCRAGHSVKLCVISKTAHVFTLFAEPFDTASWMLVGVVAIQAATFTIFFFEWLSPSGFDMKVSSATKYYWFWSLTFVGAFAKYCEQRLWASSCLSCCLNWTGRIFMKSDFEVFFFFFFWKSVEKIQILLKSDKNNEHFTWRPTYFFLSCLPPLLL